MILLLLLVTFVSGSISLVAVSPTNRSMSSSSRITYTINLTDSNSTTHACTLYTTENSSGGIQVWAAKVSSSVDNNSVLSFTPSLNVGETATGIVYDWNVNCNSTEISGEGTWITNLTDRDGLVPAAALGNSTFGVDTRAPEVTVEGYRPLDLEWLTVRDFTLGLIVNDSNPEFCFLGASINATFNTSRAFEKNITNLTYTNTTAFNFTGFDAGNTSMDDNGTGVYKWSYFCNDTAGNVATSENFTFWIDTTAPTDVGWNFSHFFTSPGNVTLFNLSTSTDYTPSLGWNITEDKNFSHYNLKAYNDSGKASLAFEFNISTLSTLAANMTQLAADVAFRLVISVFDKAGNSATGPTDINYTTTSICHDLNEGWNICGNLGDARNLGQYLTDFGASTVAYFNKTNEFETYVDGGDKAAVSVPFGRAIFAFMESSGEWEDSVHNSTDSITESILINRTNTAWNIVVVNNESVNSVLQKVDYLANGNLVTISDSDGDLLNVSVMSFYNNSASNGTKYIPFVGNLSINNATPVLFGDVIWMHLEKAVDTNITLNWGFLTT